MFTVLAEQETIEEKNKHLEPHGRINRHGALINVRTFDNDDRLLNTNYCQSTYKIRYFDRRRKFHLFIY